MQSGPRDFDTSFPERVGQYELLAPIGSGGMAKVFLARRCGPGGFEREVALKLTHAHLSAEPTLTTELIEEGKLASRVRHANVVNVHAVEDSPYGVFLVMDYIEGDTLSTLLRHARGREERIPIRIALRIVLDVLAGLHAAHELRDASGNLSGLVHRDVSPQNILVGIDGVSRLTDFGVAKAADRRTFTQEGVIKGKVGYMSPEQVRDLRLDRRSDIWATGVVVWELLAGQRLFPSGDSAGTLLRILKADVQRIREVRPDVPAAVDEAIASALTADCDLRCPDAKTFFDRIVGEPDIADGSEVAAYVRQAAGERLAQLRTRVTEIKAQRSKTIETTAFVAADSAAVAVASESPTVDRTAAYSASKRLLLYAAATLAAVATVGVVRARWVPSPASRPDDVATTNVAMPAVASGGGLQLSAPSAAVNDSPPASVVAAPKTDAPITQPQTRTRTRPAVRPPISTRSTAAASASAPAKLYRSPYE
jgi:serine/threonine-protein kinase